MSYDSDKIKPYDSEDSKREQIEQMFNNIASKYDRLNKILSLGMDKMWRRKSLNKLKDLPTDTILDIATGTGDLAILSNKMLKPISIVGVDLSDGMMDIGRKKVDALGLSDVISFDNQDCASLQFEDNSFDVAIASFGVRNFEQLDKCFQEIVRVVKPGGHFLFTELSTPRRQPIHFFYNLYTNIALPLLGKAFSDDSKAYKYLPQSIAAFPQGEKMVEILLRNGFETASFSTYTFGTCTTYLARKVIN